MVVTRVVINNYTPKASGTCAEATVILDDMIAVHKVSVIRGERGYFISMPNTGHTKIYNGKKRFEDLVHPLNHSLSVSISDAVLNCFHSYKK